MVTGLLIFLMALGLRLYYVNTAVIDTPIRADAAKYYTIANNLLNLGVYSSQTGTKPVPEIAITPGYPFFIASVLSMARDNPRFSYGLILNLQAVLGAVIVLITYLVGLLFLPFWAALAAGLLAALSPHLIVICGYVLTEALFTFFFMLAVYLVLQAWLRAASHLFLCFGLVAGIASLVRPALGLYPFCVAAGLLLITRPGKIRLKIAGFIILGFLVVWGPWSYWKHQAAANMTVAYSPTAASFALGIYPDLIYQDPRLRGFPYMEDPAYTDMSRNFRNALAVLQERVAAEPARYLYWYAVGKPLTYWSWSIIAGQGGLLSIRWFHPFTITTILPMPRSGFPGPSTRCCCWRHLHVVMCI